MMVESNILPPLEMKTLEKKQVFYGVCVKRKRNKSRRVSDRTVEVKGMGDLFG